MATIIPRNRQRIQENYLNGQVENHGGETYAMRTQCPCDKCKAARQQFRNKRSQREKARRDAKRGYEYVPQPFKHGTKYGWSVKRCDCELCTANKVAYRERNLERERERRRAKRLGVQRHQLEQVDYEQIALEREERIERRAQEALARIQQQYKERNKERQGSAA